LEEAEHVAGLVRIKMQDEVLSQEGPKPKERLRGQPQGGVRAAARVLAIDHKRASRSLAIAELPAKVKAAIRAAKLDDNQALLLRLAKLPNEAAQVAYTVTVAERGSRKRSPVTDRDGDVSIKNRRILWQELVGITAKHLGKDVNRFAQLTHDIGKRDLIEFADAVQAWRVSNAKPKSGLEAGPAFL
jgi:hypothetical protein